MLLRQINHLRVLGIIIADSLVYSNSWFNLRRLGCPARRQHSPRRPTVITCLAAVALAFIASATCFVKLSYYGLGLVLPCFIILCKVVAVVFHRDVVGCKRSFCGRLACRTPSNTLALVYITLQQKTTLAFRHHFLYGIPRFFWPAFQPFVVIWLLFFPAVPGAARTVLLPAGG